MEPINILDRPFGQERTLSLGKLVRYRTSWTRPNPANSTSKSSAKVRSTKKSQASKRTPDSEETKTRRQSCLPNASWPVNAALPDSRRDSRPGTGGHGRGRAKAPGRLLRIRPNQSRIHFADTPERPQKSKGRTPGFSQDAAAPGWSRRHERFPGKRFRRCGRNSAATTQPQEQGEVTIAEDAEFHYSVALASGNGVVLKVISTSDGTSPRHAERSLQVMWTLAGSR